MLGVAELVLLGLLVDWGTRKLKLPGLIGLLFLGIVVGPSVMDALNPKATSVFSEMRVIALLVILLRAGLEVSREALSRVGVRALLMAFIPCICETVVVTAVGPHLLELTYMESAILGTMLAAVSPAVVVPLMIGFIEQRRGADKGAPTLVLAGASCDDAVAIVLCTSLVGMYVGEAVSWGTNLLSVPLSIVSGIVVGLLLGLVMCRLFDRFNPRATKRVLILLGLAVILLELETFFEYLPFAALLAVMAMGFMILEKREHTAHEISSKLGKVWVLAQLLLFIIVGTQVDLAVAMDAGLGGAVVIFFGLLGRGVGVQLCLLKSNYDWGERLFIALSYLPKATVQAAMAAVPLVAMQQAGMPEMPGQIMLAVAVLSIVLTAPLGALAISWAGPRFLSGPEGDHPTSAQQAAVESRA